MIRILIADDSLTTRLVLKDLVARDDGIAVIGEAVDGREAVEKTIKLRPDLVIMDIMMPAMDGLSATMEIMGRCPTPILILSADADEDSDNAFQAIQFGALDVMAKPVGAVTESFDAIAENLIEKIKILGRIPVMHHFRRQSRPQPTAPQPPPDRRRNILAIGASTGGPRAVAHLLCTLSPATHPRILVVQHIAKGFAGNFAQWLDKESPFSVRLAEHGDRMRDGVALVAPNNCHMEVRNERIILSDAPPINSCRPSVDALFLSLAQRHASECIAVLLTGMGRDGTAGMLALRRKGGYNIVQDEASSTVFGMPRSAIEARAAHQVLPLTKITEAVDHLLRGKSTE
ncbi:MAG: chemotaxis-specific protein-glutamate methyltransferase CheB [Desulfuromonadales bacterium]|nr:chemotaxis-specific protein-glutamate methyltransferase CheB [Desulfuromonadales bacterium]NIR33028.1 chemotaxis-specific protein-glutamate methyltransferase CheB [Desulfuromonadales bacterium]NIS39271.1 chemotaxis-specific protein-glutamate methyltransferase CheB [Desulfuromonadales bacterium]